MFLYLERILYIKESHQMADQLIPSVIIEVIAVVSGTIVSIGIPLVLTKLNKINKLHTTVFGIQEVASIGGLVNDVDNNSDRLDRLEQGQQEIKDSVDEICKRLNCED